MKTFFKKLKIQYSKKSLIFLAVFAAILVVDLVTKYYAQREQWKGIIIKGLLEVGYVENHGMAFSMLANASWGRAFLIAFTVFMSIAIIILILFIPERFTILKLCLYMILAGALGNLYDRIEYGYVRDFLWMAITGATGNVADLFIVVGAILAIVDLLFLNEISVFPIPKKSREIQAQRRREEQEKQEKQEKEAEQKDVENGGTDDGGGGGG